MRGTGDLASINVYEDFVNDNTYLTYRKNKNPFQRDG